MHDRLAPAPRALSAAKCIVLPWSLSLERDAMSYDVVTIGGGFSGLVTACRAAELGLKAAVLEARTEDRYPCSSRFTTGVSNVMGLGIMAEPDLLYQAIIRGSGSNATPALARAIADNGTCAIDWLAGQGARFI